MNAGLSKKTETINQNSSLCICGTLGVVAGISRYAREYPF
jgi:hypothetical protein